MKVKAWIAFAVVFALIGGYSAYASAIPGSSSDPLVAQSYVDKKISELTDLINSRLGTGTSTGGNISVNAVVDEVMARLALILPNSGSTTFKVVQVNAGQTVLCGEGTELILRSGGAVAVCPGENGIADLTDGRDIQNGTQLSENHQLLVPRSDGRGFFAITDCYFMIKGSYTAY